MDINELKKNIDSYIGSITIPDIPCCEDDTKSYKAYNDVDKMYGIDNDIELGINYFETDINMLATKLNVDYNLLNNLYINNHFPSKGLTIAIMIALNYDLDRIIDTLNKFSYKLTNSVSDKIIRYFINNDIRDINLLNDILVSYGEMYLYSKKKLK